MSNSIRGINEERWDVTDEASENVIVCEICNAWSATGPRAAAQLRGHHMKCKVRQSKPLDMKTPEELQAELKEAKTQLAALQAEQSGPEPAVGPEPRKRDQPDRKERIPIGVRRKRLNLPEDAKFSRRIFNDNWRHDPLRIQAALDGGYVVMAGLPQNPVGTNEDGSAKIGIPMQIPIELYEQDQRAKQKIVDRSDAAIQSGTFMIDEKDRGKVTSKAEFRTELRLSQADEEIMNNG